MDLGLSGKKALVCASTKGLGKGCAISLVKECVDVTIVSRSNENIEKAISDIQKDTGVVVSAIQADVTRLEDRKKIIETLVPDILVNNAGGPPPGDFRNFTIEDWQKAVNDNMITPIEFIKAYIDEMIKNKFGRIINITSAAVKAPIDILGLSNGARTGLTGFIAGISRKTVEHNVTINNILPGMFDTDRLTQTLDLGAKMNKISYDEMKSIRLNSIPAKRFGNIHEFGDLCAYLCSEQASFITGQNFLIDGGAYPGTF